MCEWCAASGTLRRIQSSPDVSSDNNTICHKSEHIKAALLDCATLRQTGSAAPPGIILCNGMPGSTVLVGIITFITTH